MSDSFAEEQHTPLNESHRPSSIDLSLELERQLDAESLPNSPNPQQRQSLDTAVLVSLIGQLRSSLEDRTKERDALSAQLVEARTQEQGMREALEHVAEKCLHLENDLDAAVNQHKEDEETISMLRTKVEESRCAGLILRYYVP